MRKDPKLRVQQSYSYCSCSWHPSPNLILRFGTDGVGRNSHSPPAKSIGLHAARAPAANSFSSMPNSVSLNSFSSTPNSLHSILHSFSSKPPPFFPSTRSARFSTSCRSTNSSTTAQTGNRCSSKTRRLNCCCCQPNRRKAPKEQSVTVTLHLPKILSKSMIIRPMRSSSRLLYYYLIDEIRVFVSKKQAHRK